MTQYGFYFDADSCIGCHTCAVACKDAHDLPVGVNFRTVRTFTCGEGFKPHLYHISMSCAQCEQPSCEAACGQDAFYRDELGVVRIDQDKCTGCGDCAGACPYDAITLWDGKAAKCMACCSLRAQGETPACVASCPQRALEFGPIDELRAAHASELLSTDAAPLPSSALTSPNLIIRLKPCMQDKDFDEIII
ncbi:MAG: 4Fe-4S dicluster domain-containing protein [Coriobacteriales bacterium]|jgi:anaerobic dimethyl sulfoxide reductase subunit B (iron-sulfur subunit)|nr:4Fe-4S dicluster domain-containing protein [Coriobacteriales bacterium]